MNPKKTTFPAGKINSGISWCWFCQQSYKDGLWSLSHPISVLTTTQPGKQCVVLRAKESKPPATKERKIGCTISILVPQEYYLHFKVIRTPTHVLKPDFCRQEWLQWLIPETIHAPLLLICNKLQRRDTRHSHYTVPRYQQVSQSFN